MPPSRAASEVVTGRLAAWRAALSPTGSAARLAQRLRFLGWSEEEALSRLAGDELFPDPVDAIVADLLARGRRTFESAGIEPSPVEVPFAEIFAVFARVALDGLPSGAEFFGPQLVSELGEIAAPTLIGELRAGSVGTLKMAQTYADFVRDLQAGRLHALLARRPVLGRQLGLALRNARAAAGEFLERLETDRAWLPTRFPGAEGELMGLEADFGDAHRGGRRVLILTFRGGAKLVYKPRGLRMDVAWHGLLRWLREWDDHNTLRAPFAVDCGDYGWVEFVAPGRPEDPAEYYRCAGELLALAWLCGGSDFHEENLIATAHGPVLIDLETLFTPVVRPFGAVETDLADAADEPLFGASVLSTLLLPVWQIDEHGKARDLSGLMGAQREGASWHEPQWIDLGTLRLRQEMRPRSGRQPQNIPRDARGALISATGFVPEIVMGFRRAAHTMLAHRANLPLEDFRGAEIRFLVRNTQVYGVMRARLRDPKFLASSIDRSIELEKLSRPFFPLDTALPEPEVFRCYEAERRGIEQGDIPVFHARTDETTLRGDGGVEVHGYFWKTGWEIAQQKLRQLDEAAIVEQTALVSSSLQLRYVPPEAPLPVDFTEMAVAIAEDLTARTVPLPSGGVSWLSLGFDPVRKMQNAGLMGLDLYSGAVGVAIFLAALARVTGDSRWKQLAHDATRPRLLAMQAARARPFLVQMPLGIGSGLGSLIYGCQTLAALLGDASYLDDARFFAGLVRDRDLDSDHVHDILGGGAGAILSLLNLYQETREADLLDTARQLGRGILERRTMTPGGERVWQPDFADHPLTGLGHGAAGFAWALGRLGKESGERRFADAAAEAIAYERRVFDDQAANWPDFRRHARSAGGRAFMHGWCAGEPGIGLARLAQFGDRDSDALAEIAVAIRDARQGPALTSAHLCCGQTARIELLLEASRLGGHPDLREEARLQATRLLEARGASGFFPLNGADHGRLFAPSFFQGCTGIGYTFLRFIDDTLPSIATFQTAQGDGSRWKPADWT